MAVPPKFAATRLLFGPPTTTISTAPPARHTIEVFLDYCCPFSARMFSTLTTAVTPRIRENPRWAPNIELVLRQQIQPWHPSSTLMHEAALAVLASEPALFWDFSAVLFRNQRDYFDAAVVNETRNDTYERLASLAASVGVDMNDVLDRLRVAATPGPGGELNGGNQVTADVKLITKMGRLVGVHVTPTVIFDGVVRSEISSSWTADQWCEFLAEAVGELTGDQ